MAQPRAYTRSKDFTENFGNESDHSALNAELDAAGNSINDIRTNLAKIQGDDGKIKPGSITSDSVSADLKDSLVDQTTESVKPLLSEVKENANAAEAAKTISIAQAAAAATSETNAGTRATAAASSASSASSSATAASGSASAAAGSASSASTSAVNAASSATAAAGSASSASSSATSASTSASTASTKAGEAASSASSASTSASSAATAASTATAVTSGLANTSGASLVGYLPQGANGAATTTKGALDRLIKPRVDGNISRKIVFAGSSVASGNNATSNNGWAQQVGTQLTARGWTVAHESVGGNTTQLLLNRFHSDVIVKHAPDICVIALNLNNEAIQAQGTIAGKETIYNQFIANMKKLILLCRQNYIVPVVTGNYPNDGFGTDDYKFLRSVNRWLDSQNVASIAWLDTLDNGSGHWKTVMYSDGTHPNDTGHSAMYYCVPISLFEGLLDGAERKRSSSRGAGWKTTGVPASIPVKAVFDTPMRSYAVAFRCATAEPNKGIWGVNSATADTRLKTSGGVYILDCGNGTTISSTVPVDGKEHHHAVVYDHWDSKIYYYIDRNLIGSATFQQPDAAQYMAFLDRASGGVPVLGSVSDVLIYRTVLSASTIQAIYEGDVPKSSLEIYCPLGDPETAQYSRAANLVPTASYLFIQSAGVVVDTNGAGSKLATMNNVASGSADPTTSDIVAGTWRIWKNTTSGAVKLWANDGGTMKSVALT